MLDGWWKPHVCAPIGWKSNTECYSKMNQKTYKEIVQVNILGKKMSFSSHEFVFQQDNASNNTVSHFKNAFHQQIKDYRIPAKFPELNIIANLYATLPKDLHQWTPVSFDLLAACVN